MEHTLYVSRSGKIAVGNKFSGKIPVINDMDWNRFPTHCGCIMSKAVISSASGAGTGIFKLMGALPEECRWMANGEETFGPLYESDEADGESSAVKFHPLDGRILAAGYVNGKISLILYSSTQYAVADVYEYVKKERIASLAWHPSGKYLIASLQPSSKLIFLSLLPLDVDNKNGNLSFSLGLYFMGEAKIPCCPEDSNICTLFHPNDYLLTCATKSDYITMWHLQASSTTGWMANRLIKCGTGIISMSINQTGEFLTTLQSKDAMKIWTFNIEDSCRIQFSKKICKEHYRSTCDGYSRRQVITRSCASAVDTSRNLHIATAGSDDLMTSNTILVHKDVPHLGWMKACQLTNLPTSPHRINCIQFNPNLEQGNISLSTGGGGGFIHLWTLSDTYLAPDLLAGSRDETYYYMGDDGDVNKELEQMLPHPKSGVNPYWFPDENARLKYLNDDFIGTIHEIVEVDTDALPIDIPEGMDSEMEVDDEHDEGSDGDYVPTDAEICMVELPEDMKGLARERSVVASMWPNNFDTVMKTVKRRLQKQEKEADSLRKSLKSQTVAFCGESKAELDFRTVALGEAICSSVDSFHAKDERENREIISIIEPAFKDGSLKLNNIAHEVQKASKSSGMSEDLRSFLLSMNKLLSSPGAAD